MQKFSVKIAAPPQVSLLRKWLILQSPSDTLIILLQASIEHCVSLKSYIFMYLDRSSTVPSRKKLKGRDNPRVDGGVALHVLDWQSAAGDRLHTGRQRDASGTQSQAGRGPGRGSQHESPAILLHLGLGQCIEIANDGGP